MRCTQCHTSLSYADYRIGYCVVSKDSFHEVQLNDPEKEAATEAESVDSSPEPRWELAHQHSGTHPKGL